MHFDSDDVPERERVGVLHDVFARQYMNASLGLDGAQPFRATMQVVTLPEVGLSQTRCSSAFSLRRDRDMLADGRDEIILTLKYRGTDRYAQLGREVVVGPGEALVFGAYLASTAHIGSGGGDAVVITVPRATLVGWGHDPERLLVRTLPRQLPALRLLRRYAGALFEEKALDTKALAAAGRHVLDLIALVCGANRDAVELARRGGLRAARLKALEDDILANLTSDELSIDALARRHGISVRYIGLLFQAKETTFTDFVRQERLKLAWQRLVSPRHQGESITAIAYGSGFNDVSYFNRVFRRQYGMSPSDARAMAVTEP